MRTWHPVQTFLLWLTDLFWKFRPPCGCDEETEIKVPAPEDKLPFDVPLTASAWHNHGVKGGQWSHWHEGGAISHDHGHNESYIPGLNFRNGIGPATK